MTNFLTNEKIWLPKNYKWNELNKFTMASFYNSVFIPVLTAFILFLIRILFEKTIGLRVGRYLKIPEVDLKKFKKNNMLEIYYKQNSRSISESVYLHLSKETNMSVDDLKAWFTLRKALDKPSKMKKFTESFWRFVFYLAIWVYGLIVLVQKSWFWTTIECWKDYPEHLVTSDIYWYYMIELGFYLSLLVTQFFDVKRKDFWQMFLHHIVTILLLFLSYFCNFTRIGSIVIFIHDCVDSWLELVKMGAYAKLKETSNTIFFIFITIWFITRLLIFPFRILYSTTIEAPQVIGPFIGYYIFNILLYILQALHVFWFYIICHMAYKAITNGCLEKDDRSETDSESEKDKNK